MFKNSQLYVAMKHELYKELEKYYFEWKNNYLADSDFALKFFIINHAIKYSNSKLNNLIYQKKIDCEILDNFIFKKVKLKAIIALKKWINGEWNFYFTDKILSPFQVLDFQTQGIRPVTFKMQAEHKAILHKVDALEFFLHDLEHGYMFFHDEELKQMQINFFNKIQNSINLKVWDDYLLDESFKEKFYYVVSDMNTHREHYKQYLKSMVMPAHFNMVDQLFTEI